jgi:phosphopentomutase
MNITRFPPQNHPQSEHRTDAFIPRMEVSTGNTTGSGYWESQGWQLRDDIKRYSLVRNGARNA